MPIIFLIIIIIDHTKNRYLKILSTPTVLGCCFKFGNSVKSLYEKRLQSSYLFTLA